VNLPEDSAWTRAGAIIARVGPQGVQPCGIRLCLQSPSRLIQPDIHVLALEERLDLLLDNFIEYERDFLDPKWFRNSPRDL
jgi:hypothetical protein